MPILKREKDLSELLHYSDFHGEHLHCPHPPTPTHTPTRTNVFSPRRRLCSGWRSGWTARRPSWRPSVLLEARWTTADWLTGTSVSLRIHTHARMYTCTCTHTCTHARARTHVHMHVHAHTHTHTHTHNFRAFSHQGPGPGSKYTWPQSPVCLISVNTVYSAQVHIRFHLRRWSRVRFMCT